MLDLEGCNLPPLRSVTLPSHHHSGRGGKWIHELGMSERSERETGGHIMLFLEDVRNEKKKDYSGPQIKPPGLI